MKKFKAALVFFLILFSYLNSYSQEGCKIGDVIHYGNPSGFLGLSYPSTPAIPAVRTCPTTNSLYATNLHQILGDWPFTFPKTCSVSGLGTGTVYSYSVAQCPIDDYVWLIMAITGGVGFCLLRKRDFMANI